MNASDLEQLKSEWLDRVVSVRDDVPELRRFAGWKGVVKSVNWNGDCLVEWETKVDTGWYDIAPEQLVGHESPSAESA